MKLNAANKMGNTQNQKPKSVMDDTFPWKHGVFKLCQGGDAVLVLNCRKKILNMISEIRIIIS